MGRPWSNDKVLARYSKVPSSISAANSNTNIELRSSFSNAKFSNLKT